MATPFPAVTPASVEVIPLRSQVATIAPGSFATQVQDRGGFQYRITVRFEKLDRTAAALVCDFVDTLAGMSGTFDFDLDPWCPGISPAPGTREFRLATPNVGWTGRGAVEFACQFSASEDVNPT
jgi:hypothetical protein